MVSKLKDGCIIINNITIYVLHIYLCDNDVAVGIMGAAIIYHTLVNFAFVICPVLGVYNIAP